MLRIASACTTREAFVSVFGRYCDGEIIFVATRSPRPAGEELSFTITLAGGEPLIVASGEVVETCSDGEGPAGRAGMFIRFLALSPQSRALVAELAAVPSAAEGFPRGTEPPAMGADSQLDDSGEGEGVTRPSGLPRAVVGPRSTLIGQPSPLVVKPAATPPPILLQRRDARVRPGASFAQSRSSDQDSSSRDDEAPTGVKTMQELARSRVRYSPASDSDSEFSDESSWNEASDEVFGDGAGSRLALRADADGRLEGQPHEGLADCAVYEDSGVCDEAGLPSAAPVMRPQDTWEGDETLPPWLRGPAPDPDLDPPTGSISLGGMDDDDPADFQQPPMGSELLRPQPMGGEPRPPTSPLSRSNALELDRPPTGPLSRSNALDLDVRPPTGPLSRSNALELDRPPTGPLSRSNALDLDVRPPTGPLSRSNALELDRPPTGPLSLSSALELDVRSPEPAQQRSSSSSNMPRQGGSSPMPIAMPLDSVRIERPRARWPLALAWAIVSGAAGLVVGYLVGIGEIPLGGGEEAAAQPSSAPMPEPPAATAPATAAARPAPAAAASDTGEADAAAAPADEDDPADLEDDGADDAPPAPPAPTQALAADKCGAAITSDPPGAEIAIGDQIFGTTPARLELPCGPHEVEVRRSRYESAQRKIRLRPGRLEQVQVRLGRPDHKLRIVSTPLGATVTVNGRPAGVTPLVMSVKGYQHVKVRVERPGFEPWSRKVYAREPMTRVSAKLNPDRAAPAAGVVTEPARPAPGGAAPSIPPAPGATEGGGR